MIITRIWYESPRFTARKGARPYLERLRGREGGECDRKWFLNVRVHHQKAPVTTSHEWRRLKADGHENSVLMQSCKVCVAVVIRICSNHIHPPLFSQIETHTVRFPWRGGGEDDRVVTMCLWWLKLLLQSRTHSWLLQRDAPLSTYCKSCCDLEQYDVVTAVSDDWSLLSACFYSNQNTVSEELLGAQSWKVNRRDSLVRVQSELMLKLVSSSLTFEGKKFPRK